MDEQVRGGCACGWVRYNATVHDHDAYLCHCRMCQRATGSISIALKNVNQSEIDWERQPDWYDSSPIADRPYCRECGTSLGFRFKDGSGKNQLLHSLNGSSLALPRILACLLENNQSDSGIRLPGVLHKYFGSAEIS